MADIFPSSLSDQVTSAGIVAVLVIDRVEDSIPLAKALLAGGVRVMELTLRTEAALGALETISREVPEMIAGAGTVLTPEQVKQVKSAGAAFAVSPGVNRRVMDAAVDAGIAFAPGVATPSDIETALEYDCRLLKFFPCEPSGGLPFLKAMAAPYQHLGVKFIPLGGINAANMATYLASPLVAALGGSWLAPRDLIKGANWEKITDLAREAVNTINSTRS